MRFKRDTVARAKNTSCHRGVVWSLLTFALEILETEMNRIALSFLGFFFSIIALTNVVNADEVILENGDKLTGTLMRLENGQLVLNTEYAGEITIQVEKVSHLTTDEPMATTLIDGTTRKARVFYRDTTAENVTPEEEKTPMDVNIAEVKNIYLKQKPPIRLKGRTNVGITIEKGNTDTEQYRIDAELVARTEKQRFTLGGELNREQADNTTTVANWKAYGMYDYFIKPKWFLYGSSLFDHDEFADLDLRTTLGAGAGHQFFESEDLNLSVSAGLAYIFENFIVAEDDDFAGAQWLVQYDQFFFNKSLQLFHSNNGYISLEQGSNWLINTRQGLRFPLYKGFVTTLQYNYDYNNDPSPDSVSKWDSAFLFLLGYHFSN
jgi:putative salt-induced outer membrane protein YdiY